MGRSGVDFLTMCESPKIVLACFCIAADPQE
jgi:hypothetical protein